MQEMDSKMDSMVQEKFMLFAKQIGIQIPTELMEMNNIGRTTQQNPSSCQSVGDDPFANIQVSKTLLFYILYLFFLMIYDCDILLTL